MCASGRGGGDAPIAHRITRCRSRHRHVRGTDAREAGARGTRPRGPPGCLHGDRRSVRALGHHRAGLGRDRTASGQGWARGRARHESRAGRPARSPRCRGQAHPREGRADGAPVRGSAGCGRLRRLAVLRRGRRYSGPALRRGQAEPAAGQARGPRPHRPGPRDHRRQADPGCPRGAGRRAPGGALQLHPARPRVDLHRGQPQVDEPLHQPVAGQRPGGPQAPADDRDLVRPGSQS